MRQSGAETFYDGILPCAERPSRYIDRELNLASRGFRGETFNVLLVFPDAYEIGMSYQGIRFLYHRLARIEGVGVEFACAPWPDMERLLRGSSETLRSIQTGTPVGDFDLVGVSLTYELHYTNLLAVCDLAGIPLEAAGRGEDDPLVVAGGPCCSNPLPFLAAVDAVFLGDGEESLSEAVMALRAAKDAGATRNRLRETLAGVAGVYVAGVSDTAAARIYALRGDDLALRPIVPAAEIVHDRLSVEIQRGCTRGCRYCHAGMINRPRRERTVDEIVEAACAGLDASGWDEVSLLSLSTSDYSRLDELLARLTPELEARRVSLALPSLRPETITAPIIAASSLVRRSGFTVAPEAGTERLRRVINRGMTNDEILDGCLRIIEGGWQRLKLYFMMGLPTETPDDIAGIADLVGAICALPRGAGRFTLGVAVSPFVPKVNTPFQWERLCPLDELREKGALLRRRIRHRRVQLSIRDPAVSLLEGIMARGDRRLWPVLVSAYRLGCRFDGWRDEFRFDLWIRAFREHGLDPSDFTGARPVDGPLPWEAFVAGVSRSFLLRERERAYAGRLTADCREGECAGCGACGGRNAGGGAGGAAERDTASRPVDAADERAAARTTSRQPGDTRWRNLRTPWIAPDRSGPDDDTRVFRYRFLYERRGRARFLSHLEVMRIIQRALRATGWPLRFSRGFHPHPRLSMGPSLAVGTEGSGEFFDVELCSPTDCALEEINHRLPDGIDVRDHVGPFTRRMGKLPQEVRFRYRLGFGALAGADGLDARILPDPAVRIAGLWRAMIRGNDAVVDRKGRSRRWGSCSVGPCDGEGALELTVDGGGSGAPTPRDLLRTVLPERLIPLVATKRLEILYKTGDSFRSPLDLVRRRA